MDKFVEFLFSFFEDTWAFLFTESKLCFACLLLVTVVILILFVTPAIVSGHRKTLLDKFRRDVGVPFKRSWSVVLRRMWLYIRLNRISGPVLGTLVIVLSWFYATDICEKLILKFNDDEFGVLICRFSGPDLNQYYGSMGIARKIDNEIRQRILPNLRDTINLRFSNKCFRDFEEAESWGRRQNASLTIWGTTEVSDDSIFVWMAFAGMKSTMLYSAYSEDHYGIGGPRSTRLRISRSSGGHIEKISNWVRDFVLLRLVNLTIEQDDWESALYYIAKYKNTRDRVVASQEAVISMYEAYCYSKIQDWGNCLEAATHLDSIVCHDPNVPGSLKSMVLGLTASSRFNLGDTLGALNTLRRAHELELGTIEAATGLQEVFLQMGELDSSKYYGDEVLKVDPDNFTSNLQMATALIMNGQGKASIPYLQVCNRQDPTDLGTAAWLMNMYLTYVSAESTLALVDRVDTPSDTSFEIFQLGKIRALIVLDSLDAVERILDVEVESHKCLAIAFIMLADVAMRRHDTLSSIEYMRSFEAVESIDLDSCCEWYRCPMEEMRRNFEELAAFTGIGRNGPD